MKVTRFDYPGADLAPGERYAEAHRAWQGVPSLALTRGGRLFAGFMSGGIYEPDPRNCGILLFSDDGGDHWSAPVLALNGLPRERKRNTDIELWVDPDGKLHLFWCEAPYPEGLPMPDYQQKMDMENDSEYHRLEGENRTMEAVCADPDAEELVFSAPRVLFPGILRNRPFVSANGTWLYPVFLTPPRGYYEFYRSEDRGGTFAPVRCEGRALTRNFDEPVFYQADEKTVAVLLRQRDPVFVRALSRDDGKTWSRPEVLCAAASQRPCAMNLADGRRLLITSLDPGKRNGLRLWLSEDGMSFETAFSLDTRERVSYPEAVQAADGSLFVVWDRERNNKIRKNVAAGISQAAKEILFARIPPEALKIGSDFVPDVIVISRAQIHTLKNEFTE